MARTLTLNDVHITAKAARSFIESCKAAGVPKDQLQAFVSAGYVPQPKQAEFHAKAREFDNIDLPTNVPLNLGFGGARGPGKTHAIFEQVSDDCMRRKGLRALILRRTGAALEDTIAAMSKLFFGWSARLVGSHIRFPTGSYAKLGHYRNASDIDRHLGQSWDVVAVEESTTLAEERHRMIDSTLRTTRNDWRARKYESTNPGSVSHHRYKRLFIDRDYRDNEDGRGFFHIQSTVDDNIILMRNDPAYVARLDAMVGWEHKAYRLGLWDIAAGAYFTNFNRDIHVRRDIEIRPNWTVWASLDYGWTHPTVCHFHAMDDDGNRYTTHEISLRKTPIVQICEEIRSRGYTIKNHGRIAAGHDCFASDQNGKTIASEFAKHKVPLKKANISRIPGWQEMSTLLGDYTRKVKPRWFISEGCKRLIEEIGRLQIHPDKPLDVLKVNADPETGEGGDDAADSARYGMMEKARTDKPPPKTKRSRKPDSGLVMPGY